MHSTAGSRRRSPSGTARAHPVPAALGAIGILEAIDGREVMATNPFSRVLDISVECELPAPLAERGWSIAASSHGAHRFLLPAWCSRPIRLTLSPGLQIWPAALADPGARDIVVRVCSGHRVLQLHTFRLDPDRVAVDRQPSGAVRGGLRHQASVA